ncbi:hypothetical protein HYC85_004214 [Camellia sinensis]|uniref:Pectate lyase n=1 Tax=Camellia sinensis TaxID=4442 RepID=A0A7J7HWG1_CAMSI|nr:hypothetical protein HYC85_004214 [Camellia sinensis]
MLGMAQVMLFEAHDSSSQDAILQITVAFNHFGKRLIQRMPRCRWGLFHIVNNDYTHWNMYAIGGSNHPTIISQASEQQTTLIHTYRGEIETGIGLPKSCRRQRQIGAGSGRSGRERERERQMDEQEPETAHKTN